MSGKRNNDLRLEARAKGVSLWQVAQELKVSEMTLFRWLRCELSEDRRDQIVNAIEKISRRELEERG